MSNTLHFSCEQQDAQGTEGLQTLSWMWYGSKHISLFLLCLLLFFFLHVYSSSSFLGLPWKRSKGLELTYRRSLILVPDLASALHLWRNRVSDKGSRIILSRFAEPGRDAWVAAPRPFMMSCSFETHIWLGFFPPPKIITLSPKRSWSFSPNFSLRKKSI